MRLALVGAATAFRRVWANLDARAPGRASRGMRQRPGTVRRGSLAAVVLAGFAASLSLNLPGHFEPDSLWQLAQGRSGVFNSWHPPVMAWLLGIAERLGHGAPAFIVFDGALLFGGLLAFALLSPNPRRRALPLALLLIASPLVLIYQGVVWKDVLFADASLAGFAALAWAGRMWAHNRARYGLLLLAFALFTLSALTRQNGIIVPLCGAVALAAIVWPRCADIRPPARVLRTVGAGFAAFGAVAVIGLAATLALNAHGDGEPENLHQLKRLQVYDLAGLAHRDPRRTFPILAREAPELERFVRLAAVRYTTAGADNLETLPGGDTLLSPDGDAASREWARAIASTPVAYLVTRAEVFLSTLATPRSQSCPTVFVGIDGEDPSLLKDAGLTARYSAKDEWADRYATAFTSTPVFSHVFYGLLLVVLLGFAGRDLKRGDRRPEMIVVVFMGTAALLFAASFFVISNACDYRYLYFLDVAAMAALLHRAAGRPYVPSPDDAA